MARSRGSRRRRRRRCIAVQRSEIDVGGAGNVARNIASLGARCIFVGLVGDDDAGKTLAGASWRSKALIEPRLVVDPARPTTRKVRFVSEHYSTHMLRADWELARRLRAEIEQQLIDRHAARRCRAPAPWCSPTMPRAC